MSRVYGRVLRDPLKPDAGKRWVVVETDVNGYDDNVHVTALAQTLKLNLAESPFWANYGIPARQSIMQQYAPDFYITYIQQFYQQFFASVTVSKRRTFEPIYDMLVVTQTGAILKRTTTPT